MKKGVLLQYKKYLPVTGKTPMFTIGEGDTPLVKCERLARKYGCGQLYFKLEGCHPTGSFKDRGMVVAVAKALEDGSRAIICASTGNTSASAAAFAAYCGLECIIVVPRGNIAMGKLAQAVIYGAKIVAIEGNFDGALNIVRGLSQKHPVTLVNSLNPYRIEGQKTAAFEIIDVLGDAPDYLFLPVGNAGNITAYWKGFKEYHAAGKATRKPKMYGFQAEGAAPIVRGHIIEKPETVATAIRIGNPASWQKAVAARDESGGVIDMVSDAGILAAQRIMAAEAGVFGEPASAASLAGLIKLVGKGADFSGKVIVAVVTGNGLKDTETALKNAPPFLELPGELAAVEKALGLG
ncbi:MAG: threonine synthase [Chloroflexi bacterium RBG_16_56_11]|nr:MAG: threonine synthase [Chloroflexi bacterium RBG_16_56_11]